MKKEYIVVSIEAAPAGGPYVLVSLADPRDLRSGATPHFGSPIMSFTSLDDMMKNLQKILSGQTSQMTSGFTTTIKMDMKEYEDSGMKVGDRVNLDVTKVEKEGV